MIKDWICLMVNKTVPCNDRNVLEGELSSVFKQDLIDFKVVSTDQMSQSGEYYVFVKCSNYWEHIDSVKRCRFITEVVPNKESPSLFTKQEVCEFSNSAEASGVETTNFSTGDVVKIKEGYLSGLYGIIIKSLSNKRCEVFFGFYIRQFTEVLKMTSLEYIGKVSSKDFPTDVIEKPIVIGTYIVHKNKLHRSTR